MKPYKTLITLTVLVAVFVVGSFVGYKLLFADAPPLSDAAKETQCEPQTIRSGSTLKVDQVTVTVYNAGRVSGLANRTLINLQKKGFRPGKVGNATGGIKASDVTIVTTNRKAPQVRLVAAQFRGAVRYAKPKTAQGDNVEIVIGPKYGGLKKKTPKSTKVNTKTEVCLPVVEPEPGA